MMKQGDTGGILKSFQWRQKADIRQQSEGKKSCSSICLIFQNTASIICFWASPSRFQNRGAPQIKLLIQCMGYISRKFSALNGEVWSTQKHNNAQTCITFPLPSPGRSSDWRAEQTPGHLLLIKICNSRLMSQVKKMSYIQSNTDSCKVGTYQMSHWSWYPPQLREGNESLFCSWFI